MTVCQTDVFQSVHDLISPFLGFVSFFLKCVSEEVGSSEKDVTRKENPVFLLSVSGLGSPPLPPTPPAPCESERVFC